MKFIFDKGGDIQVIPVFNDTESLDTHDELFKFLKDRELFDGKASDIYVSILPGNDNVIFIGLGDKEKLDYQVLRKAFYKLGKTITSNKINSIGLTIPRYDGLCYKKTNLAIAEGLLQSEYTFDKYKSKKKDSSIAVEIHMDVIESKREKIQAAVEEMEILTKGIFLTRDLVNEPAINMYPETLANSAKDSLEPLNVRVDIFGQKEIENIGMEAFLAVSKGSEKEPQLIVMTYNGDDTSSEKIALVGKGLTYDSGGYCIKPAESMANMHSDMAGAAAVIGAMQAIAQAKLKRNVIGIVAACENMISGGAYKTGDIIGSMAGKTIEIGNTDAEGRVTLADSLWYAATIVKADKIIDLATLTGACVVALGSVNTGAVTNNNELMEALKKAAEISGEPLWQLPSNDEYKEQIKSHFADLKNTGGRNAGAITAGLFLEEFVDNKPWVHLDIAGTSFISKERGYLPKGATGVPVKTLFNFIKEAE